MRKALKPSLIIAASIWFLAQVMYVSISGFMTFQDKSHAFSAKANEIADCLDRRITQNFAFVRSFEIFATLSDLEAMKIFGSLVQHTMKQYPRIRTVNLYELPKDDNPLYARRMANFPADQNDAAIQTILPKVVNQPHGTLRAFADINFPGQYITTAHAENANFHYAIVMLVDAEEMIKPLLQDGSPKMEWDIGDTPIIRLNDRQNAPFSFELQSNRTIVSSAPNIMPDDSTRFSEKTVFHLSETVKLYELFTLIDLIVYCGLSTIAVVASYYALHQHQLSRRLQRSEDNALKRAARLEKETRLEHAARVNAVGELAAGIIHELAQPLSSLLNQSQASLKTLEEGEAIPQTDFLRRTMTANIREAKRASLILGRIRDYIVYKSASPEATELNSSILDIVEILNPEIKRQGVSLMLDLAEPSPTASINKIELEQVIHNLVRNAIDALSASHQTVKRITIETLIDQNNSIIRISDNGSGLSEETLEQLFQPFFTTKDSGMGLGLSLSQRIVERVNGVLSASNKNGAVFTVTLPKLDIAPMLTFPTTKAA
ncbi:ATP-binding protein [Phyllobacterium sp. OV277]|uniref:sensor histidine kinase n=1 Tax=Phyllobacterium sp. OV277 TaxID=1882772 RepID=UPI00158761ED|nr:ATP-binding protein [Phyllobacterium sp. OV277]